MDAKPTATKTRELKVLDGKSAQNLSILLSGSLKHLSYSEICDCILECNDEKLSSNQISQLIQYMPPEQQLQSIAAFKDKYDELTEAEQFCVKVSTH